MSKLLQNSCQILYQQEKNKMKNWTESKLDKELVFAEVCRKDNLESEKWYQKVLNEYKRRQSKSVEGKLKT
jgi:hypothetical protein